MTSASIANREFYEDTSRADKDASDEAMFITDRPRNIVESLSMPDLSNIDVEFPRAIIIARPAELE
jgi:hypothetical protein